jgi:hypothetical protein
MTVVFESLVTGKPIITLSWKGVLVWATEEEIIIEHIQRGETLSGVTTSLRHPVMRWTEILRIYIKQVSGKNIYIKYIQRSEGIWLDGTQT